MYLVTAAEMREIDRHAIEAIGLPAMVLMENAGRAIAEEAVEFARKQGQECGRNGQDSGFRWLILAGKGNNGGDGLVCARHLAEMGYEVGIVYAVHPDELRAEAALQRDIVRKLGLTELPEAVNEDGSWEISWRSWDGIIDA
ncbi:bifunctional ADP-dependent NAD(P)H-hydrate dehydratase/NAD(P)H-hydrate epimerase, partial [Paenibacillus sepulcri]|nr:bifunctional ADP-dependent NAD(P)H-hydrate dehydratase/NAD(P)H-hydrate epimerase [Paenibacillus sepulcri]